MRSIQTFILRLLVDTETPDALHGVIQRVEEEHPHPFLDGRTLIAWLRETARVERKEVLVDSPNQAGERKATA